MDSRKIAVIVEDVEASRTALKWALNNLMRYGDLITLLHVFPSSTSSKTRHLRLKGYQLALNFKELCAAAFPNVMLQTKVEIIVTEGDEEGRVIAAMIGEIGASVLVVGLHDHSFLYKMAMAEDDLATAFNCKVVAVKQATSSTEYSQKDKHMEVIAMESSSNMGFSQIEIAKLQAPEIVPRKISYRICPDPYAVIWRWKK